MNYPLCGDCNLPVVDGHCWCPDIGQTNTQVNASIRAAGAMLRLYREACASAVEAVAIMEGCGVAYCMRSIGKPEEQAALFDERIA